MQRRVWRVAIAVVASMATAGSAAASDVLTPLDVNVAALYTLGACASATELDCIDAVGIVDSSGKYWPGKHAGDIAVPESQDSLGNRERLGLSNWSVSTPLGTKKVVIIPNLETPSHAYAKLADGTVRRFGALRTYVQVADALNTKVRFSIRTSWLKPLNVPMFAFEPTFSEQVYRNGRRWTFEGTGVRTSAYTSDVETKIRDKARADVDAEAFYFIIDHAGESDSVSAFPTACSDLGYTAEGSNSTMAGMPWWDPTLQTLNFAVYAPHFTKAGEDNFGFFRFWSTETYMNCRWPGHTLATAPYVQVQVVNADGTVQTAVTSVGRKNGRFFIEASGFHYSAPTIRVVGTDLPGTTAQDLIPVPASVASEAPARVVAPKLRSITCVKGKTSRRVTGNSPRCPTGWKIRK